MRFYLDNDVDARCRRVLVPPHDCWTANEAGNAEADDPSQAVYAHDRQAVLVTHDAAFTRWRRKQAIGQHVWLRCEQPDGPDLLERHLDVIVPIFERRPDGVIEVKWSGIEFSSSWKP